MEIIIFMLEDLISNYKLKNNFFFYSGNFVVKETEILNDKIVYRYTEISGEYEVTRRPAEF